MEDRLVEAGHLAEAVVDEHAVPVGVEDVRAVAEGVHDRLGVIDRDRLRRGFHTVRTGPRDECYSGSDGRGGERPTASAGDHRDAGDR
ncbi:hypothetical protein PM022_20095, partial [Halorubrum ezzemoulense]|uniref:hypothetical protein n=1 Tax=Halorubrum ezzemoulense TaxID=337243 RepID=UPI00232C7DAF